MEYLLIERKEKKSIYRVFVFGEQKILDNNNNNNNNNKYL